jgi:uncharacterized membrane-anchored protein YhcB (DUF1043 family)
MGLGWIEVVLLLVGGALAGGLLMRFLGADSGREQQMRQELEETRKAFSDYKGEVEAHFRATAEAVNAMTESYRNVYEQLRAGAGKLCGDGDRLLDLRPAPLLERNEAESSEPTPQPVATEAATPQPPEATASGETAPADPPAPDTGEIAEAVAEDDGRSAEQATDEATGEAAPQAGNRAHRSTTRWTATTTGTKRFCTDGL